MRVFVTGATGYVGSAVVRALVGAGHEVGGLSRSEARDAAVRALGATPVRGELGGLARSSSALAGFEAYVHAAMDYAQGPPADREAIDALLAAARAASGPTAVLYTSGVWVLGDTRGPADESAATDHPGAAVAWRPAHERLVLDAAGERLVTAVIRPGMVYGGTRGLVTPWFAQARRGGAQIVGDGRNHWAFVHVDDLAQLYRLVVERRAGGVFHGVDGSAPTLDEAARAASAAVGGSVRHVPLEDARKAMGPLADAFAMDQVVVTRRGPELGWTPRHPAFVQAAAAAARESGG